MRFGAFVGEPIPWDPTNAIAATGGPSSLYSIALQWLKEDREKRRELETEGQRVSRGARREEVGRFLHVRLHHLTLPSDDPNRLGDVLQKVRGITQLDIRPYEYPSPDRYDYSH
jgi:hypothetical protein